MTTRAALTLSPRLCLNRSWPPQSEGDRLHASELVLPLPGYPPPQPAQWPRRTASAGGHSVP